MLFERNIFIENNTVTAEEALKFLDDLHFFKRVSFTVRYSNSKIL